MLSSNTFFQAFNFSCIHAHCLIVPRYNALFIQCTVYHSWAQSSCTDTVDIWLIAPMENFMEFPAVFQRGNGKGKCHLLQSRGGTFWLHSSRLSMTRTKEMTVSIFQTTVVFCIQFTWEHMELQLQDCRTWEPPPRSAHLDHLTQWQQGTSGTHFTTTREVFVWAQSSQGSHSLMGLRRAEQCQTLLNNLN